MTRPHRLDAVVLLDALRPYVKRPRAQGRSGSSGCEICGAPVAPAHSHVFRGDPRGILCSCSPCAVLFRDPGASAGRLRTIPERVRSAPGAAISDVEWVALGVPVGLAFFVLDGRTGRPIAYCPSPGGAVEIEIDRGPWESLAAHTPLVDALEADVEGLLVHKPRGGPAEVLLAPIDACYALAAEVRTRWRGFDGGDEARLAVGSFLADLRARSVPLAAPSTERS
jgi:hypothetical protein